MAPGASAPGKVGGVLAPSWGSCVSPPSGALCRGVKSLSKQLKSPQIEQLGQPWQHPGVPAQWQPATAVSLGCCDTREVLLVAQPSAGPTEQPGAGQPQPRGTKPCREAGRAGDKGQARLCNPPAPLRSG